MELGVGEAFALADNAAATIRDAFGPNNEVLVVLGSGWAESVPALEALSSAPVQTMDVGDIPGFKKPTALGHGGALKSICIGYSRMLLLT